ncbi:hypothetical protein BT93_D0141 [Corymbia citriodora subsp. variegata]|nr:hypothetical protein BT93_D0141 [Corymbia citriodora subsp. variegata]
MVRKRGQFCEYAEQVDQVQVLRQKICWCGISKLKLYLSGIKGHGIYICTKFPKNVQVAVAKAISNVNKLRCCSGVKTKLVPNLGKEIREHVKNLKKSWRRTGCTLMSDIWCDEGFSINIFVHSIDGTVILNALEIPKLRANNVLRYITHYIDEEGLFEIMLSDNHSHVYETSCVSNYYMLQSIMGLKWLSLGFEKDELGIEVGNSIHNSEFWIEGKEVLHALKSIFQVFHLVNSYGTASGFLYAAVEMAGDAIRQLYEINIGCYRRFSRNSKKHESFHHPIHAATTFLKPAYMCSEKFVEKQALKDGMDFILKNLVGGEEKEKFVQFSGVPKLFTSIVMTMLRTSHPYKNIYVLTN